MSLTYDLETKLSDLGLDKSLIIRAVESMAATGISLNPANLAQQLGIPKSMLYQDLEILEYIYTNQSELAGIDKLIADLLKQIKSNKRNITKLKNQIQNSSKSLESSYNEGFLKGAAINYRVKPSKTELAKEIWARGVLQLRIEAELDQTLIKSAYRKLVTLFHPDRSLCDSGEQLDTLKKAYDFLLKLYS